MRICYLNITKHIPPRDAVYLRGLKECGVEIIDIRDASPGLKKFINIYRRHRKEGGCYDLLWIGYSAQILVVFARLISRKTIIFNALSPISEGIMSRKQAFLFSPKGAYFWLVDFLSFHLASLNLIENETMIEAITKKFLISRKKFVLTWTGVDEDSFFYNPVIRKQPHFTVLFRGELANDSGIEYFVTAAKNLVGTDIKFRLLGRGPMAPVVEKMLRTFDSKNFEWMKERLDIADLRRKMQESHLSIGWLSGRLRAFSSIPHKTFESLALKLPFLHARLPAMQELLKENETGFYCRPDDAGDFANKILELKSNPKLLSRVAENGYRLFDRTLRSKHLARNLLDDLRKKKFI